jgi:DNA-binding transcriptional MocR family regulator
MHETTPIDFLRGWPAQSLLPVAHISDASKAALSKPDIFRSGLNYGDDEGYLPLRRHLARYLTRYYDTTIEACLDRICITGGCKS